MQKKAKVDNTIIDIISLEALKSTTQDDINHVGVIHNGFIYKLRNNDDNKPGIYKNSLYYRMIHPSKDEVSQYKADEKNIVDFDNTNNIKEYINAQSKLKDLENSTLTSPDGNIFIPIDRPNDAPEMLALKEAVRDKHIDINKYADRFGSNFNNDLRILNKGKITLEKLKSMCNALDISVSITLKNKNEDVPNPMSKTITALVTSDIENDEGEETLN